MKSRIAGFGHLHSEIPFLSRPTQLLSRADLPPSQSNRQVFPGCLRLVRAIRLSPLTGYSLRDQTRCPPQTGSVGATHARQTAGRREGHKNSRAKQVSICCKDGRVHGCRRHEVRWQRERKDQSNHRLAASESAASTTVHGSLSCSILGLNPHRPDFNPSRSSASVAVKCSRPESTA